MKKNPASNKNKVVSLLAGSSSFEIAAPADFLDYACKYSAPASVSGQRSQGEFAIFSSE